MENPVIDAMKEKIRSLLKAEQNLCIGSLNGGPIRLLNRYPAGDFLHFDDENFVYYAGEVCGGTGRKIKDSWDSCFRFPYLYCSWHVSGCHTFKLVKRGCVMEEFESLDDALTSLLKIRNECTDRRSRTPDTTA